MAKTDPRVTRMYDTKLVRPELQVGGQEGARMGWALECGVCGTE
jgi:hypothetical protein